MAARYVDFKCDDCNHIWIYTKEREHHRFPKLAVPCPNCGSKNTRRYWMKQNISGIVRKGQLGNSKDGYTGTKK